MSSTVQSSSYTNITLLQTIVFLILFLDVIRIVFIQQLLVYRRRKLRENEGKMKNKIFKDIRTSRLEILYRITFVSRMSRSIIVVSQPFFPPILLPLFCMQIASQNVLPDKGTSWLFLASVCDRILFSCIRLSSHIQCVYFFFLLKI